MKSYYCWIVYKDKKITANSSSVVNFESRPLEYLSDKAYALRLFKNEEIRRRGITESTLDKGLICGGVVETTGMFPEEMSL